MTNSDIPSAKDEDSTEEVLNTSTSGKDKRVLEDAPQEAKSTQVTTKLESSKNLSVVREVYDHNELLTTFNKRKIDSINSTIGLDTLKFHQYFRFRIEPTGKENLLTNFLNFENILSVKNNEVVVFENNTIFIIQLQDRAEVTFIDIDILSDSLTKVYTGYDSFEKRIFDILCNNEVGKCALTWYFKVDAKTKYYEMVEYLDDTFYYESYPYFDCENMIQEFLKSEAPILILIGPPGTGKTKLIRQIIREVSLKKDDKTASVLFTSSQEIIEQGQIYLDLVFSNADFLILEDIDFHIKPRNQGNFSLYSLLSVSSGILSSSIKNKKIILSTNLPNTKDIDDALLRPGRCFAVRRTRKLDKDQAVILAKLLKKDLPSKSDFTLAEIYN